MKTRTSADLLARWRTKKGVRSHIGPKRAVLASVLLLVLVLARFLRNQRLLDPERSPIFGWIHQYPLLTFVAFFVIYTGCVVTILPTLPFNLAAGLLWGALGNAPIKSSETPFVVNLSLLTSRPSTDYRAY